MSTDSKEDRWGRRNNKFCTAAYPFIISTLAYIYRTVLRIQSIVQPLHIITLNYTNMNYNFVCRSILYNIHRTLFVIKIYKFIMQKWLYVNVLKYLYKIILYPLYCHIVKDGGVRATSILTHTYTVRFIVFSMIF